MNPTQCSEAAWAEIAKASEDMTGTLADLLLEIKHADEARKYQLTASMGVSAKSIAKSAVQIQSLANAIANGVDKYLRAQ